jgi:hypothetical protein
VICEKCGNCIETTQDCTEIDIDDYAANELKSCVKPEYASDDSDGLSDAHSEVVIEPDIREFDDDSDDTNITEPKETPIDFNAVLESGDLQCTKCSQTGFANQVERILHESSHLKILLRFKQKKKKQREIPIDRVNCLVCGEYFNSTASLRSHQFYKYGNDYARFFDSRSSDE